MRTFKYLLLVASLTAVSFTRLQAQQLDIAQGWKFYKGDQAAFAQPGFDDKAWQPIAVGKSWESAGYENYDGLGWYRLQLNIPATLQQSLDKNYNTLLLSLGQIDDADETYFNGQRIGSSKAYDAQRKYQVPANLIKWGQLNVIAVKVTDTGGGGGMYHGPYQLAPATSRDFISAQTTVATLDGIFKNGADIKPGLELNNQSKENLQGVLVCRLFTDEHQPLKTLRQPFTVNKNSRQNIVFSYVPAKPGFYRAEFACQLNGSSDSLKSFQQYGVEPTKLKPALTRPADFNRYWQQARQELAAVTPQFKVIPKPELSTGNKNIYLVEMRSLGNALVRGWYSVPKTTGKYPALLKVQGYSSELGPDQNTPDFAVFSLNIRGHGNSKDNVNPGFPGYLLSGIEDKDQYIYRGAYMDCVRAVDFLTSRSEVDVKRIAVEGGSQGGALSFAAAALDKRIALCAPDIPFLSDFRTYFKVGNWPGSEFKQYMQQHPEKKWENVYTVLDYIDIKNLAPMIKVPLLMGVGLLDPVCPPTINFAAYNQVTSEKQYRVYPHNEHSTAPEHYTLKMNWIRQHFKMKQS
jgi:cephalosporin-C deacetylase-like acetyl esterase